MHRSVKMAVVVALILCGGVGAVLAQDYPTKPVRILAGNAGAISDVIGRHVTQCLSERWGQPVIVENRGMIAGVDLVNIQYKGGGAAMAAILAGETNLGFVLTPVAVPHVKSGKVRAYAITSAKRFAGTPEIPTMEEAGLSGFDSEDLWLAMFVPARTPAALVARINGDVTDVLRTAALRDALRGTGAEPSPSTPAELAALVARDTAALKKVIQAANIRGD